MQQYREGAGQKRRVCVLYVQTFIFYLYVSFCLLFSNDKSSRPTISEPILQWIRLKKVLLAGYESGIQILEVAKLPLPVVLYIFTGTLPFLILYASNKSFIHSYLGTD